MDYKSITVFRKTPILVEAAQIVMNEQNIQKLTLNKYINEVAKLRGVRHKGLNLKQILDRLDVDDYMREKNIRPEKQSTRWVAFKDTTRLLHCMFAGDDELLNLFREMGTSMTRCACLFITIYVCWLCIISRVSVDMNWTTPQ